MISLLVAFLSKSFISLTPMLFSLCDIYIYIYHYNFASFLAFQDLGIDHFSKSFKTPFLQNSWDRALVNILFFKIPQAHQNFQSFVVPTFDRAPMWPKPKEDGEMVVAK